MSSSYTTRKRLEKQNPGENNNTWGGFLNTNTIDLVDELFGIVSVNCGSTTGDITLSTNNGSSDEGRRSCIVILGTPASAISIFVPAQQSPYIVRGKHTTNSATIKCAGGTTGVKFDAGENGIILANGTQVREIFKTASAGTYNGVPSGSILAWSGTIANIPTGYYLCDGNNGTPNLSERFILGTVSSGGIGRTGTGVSIAIVSANVSVNTSTNPTTLTSAMIPAHAHYTFIDGLAAGVGTNRYNLGTVAANAKNLVDLGGTGDGNYQMSGVVTNANPSIGQTSFAYTSSPSGHSHSFAFEAGHTHSITLDGRPAFYSMCFIMKA